MLKFYYHPLSPLSRRVWLTLLEKQIPFEAQEVSLTQGAQFEPAFSRLNPFHHVPVIEDETPNDTIGGTVCVIESLAILDYLDAAYPEPKLTPVGAVAIAKMRMIQMVVVNELMPTLLATIQTEAGSLDQNPKREALQAALSFLDRQLGDQAFFGDDGSASFQGNCLSLADVVAGAAVPLFHRLGVGLDDYPALEQWRQRLANRPAWQTTEPDEVGFSQWRRYVQLMLKRRQKSAA
jgi:glutathione S-transferase